MESHLVNPGKQGQVFLICILLDQWKDSLSEVFKCSNLDHSCQIFIAIYTLHMRHSNALNTN